MFHKRRPLRRAAALLLALLLMCQTALPARTAVSGVYLTSVNNLVLDMDSETMPFWSGGELYVSNAIFAGGELEIFYSRNPVTQTVGLYALRDLLVFDLSSGRCYDQQNRGYAIPLITRGSYVFFPLGPVADFFGLNWSYTRTNLAPLIRITSSSASPVLSDQEFLKAGANLLQNRYDAYLRSLAPVQEEPQPPQQQQPPAAVQGQRIFLVMDAGEPEALRSMLDLLEGYGARATFTMTAGQMAGQDDLLRRLVGQGHRLAVVPRGTGEEEVIQELAEANAILWDAAYAKTRLAFLSKEQTGLRGAVEALGYAVCGADVDNSAYPLDGSRRAANLYSSLTARGSRDVRVYLGDAAESLPGMEELLRRLEAGECRVMAYRETLADF